MITQQRNNIIIYYAKQVDVILNKSVIWLKANTFVCEHVTVTSLPNI